MKESHKRCVWACRFELVGLILLAIATVLTIITGNGIGIAAMFLAGLVLFGYKQFGHKVCHVCHPEAVEEDKAPWETAQKKSAAKKTTTKKTTK